MFFGVDPGLNGAVSIFDKAGNYVNNIRMPTVTKEGSPIVKKRICAGKLKYRVFQLMDQLAFYEITATGECYLEHPNVIPSNGPVRIASLAHSIGIIEGVFVSMGIKVIYVKPQEWKKTFNIKVKKQAIIVALEQVPELRSIKMKDIDIAESVLIGLHGNRYIKPLMT